MAEFGSRVSMKHENGAKRDDVFGNFEKNPSILVVEITRKSHCHSLAIKIVLLLSRTLLAESKGLSVEAGVANFVTGVRF